MDSSTDNVTATLLNGGLDYKRKKAEPQFQNVQFLAAVKSRTNVFK